MKSSVEKKVHAQGGEKWGHPREIIPHKGEWFALDEWKKNIN